MQSHSTSSSRSSVGHDATLQHALPTHHSSGTATPDGHQPAATAKPLFGGIGIQKLLPRVLASGNPCDDIREEIRQDLCSTQAPLAQSPIACPPPEANSPTGTPTPAGEEP